MFALDETVSIKVSNFEQVIPACRFDFGEIKIPSASCRIRRIKNIKLIWAEIHQSLVCFLLCAIRILLNKAKHRMKRSKTNDFERQAPFKYYSQGIVVSLVSNAHVDNKLLTDYYWV